MNDYADNTSGLGPSCVRLLTETRALGDYWPLNLSVTTDTSQMPTSNVKLFNDDSSYHLGEATAQQRLSLLNPQAELISFRDSAHNYLGKKAHQTEVFLQVFQEI